MNNFIDDGEGGRVLFLFCCASVVDSVVFPLGDVHIHTIAGLAQGYGKLMLLSCFEGGEIVCLLQLVVFAIHVHGDEHALACSLRNDECLIVVAFFLQRSKVGSIALGS